jgi:hypothetical protein
MSAKEKLTSEKSPCLTAFDPVKLGELEVGWWQAHHRGDTISVLRLLTSVASEQYGFSFLDKKAVIHVVKAAKFHNQKNWDGAIMEMAKFYKVVKKKTGLDFDPENVAKSEVEGWKLHDELKEQEDKSPLTRAFMDLYSVIYGIDRELLKSAAEQRMLATVEHDRAEQEGIVPESAEKHWGNAKEHLITFYTQLKEAVRAGS